MTESQVEKISADFSAIQSYYVCLADQAERATRGERPAPLVPRLDELQVVDGWVVWNGHPVWSPTDNALTKAQPVRARWTPSIAQAAHVEAREQGLEATRIHLRHAADRVRGGNGSPDSRAFRLAEIAFLESLVDQQRRALRGEVAAPRVPAPGDKLVLVDGWLMWNGQPVWWSGYRPEGVVPAASGGPARASGGTGTPVRSEPRLRRLLTLPWRRATA